MNTLNFRRILISFLIVALLLWVLRPFIYPIVFAILLAIMIYPLQQKINTYTNNQNKSSLLAVLIVFLIVIVPLTFAFISTIDEVSYYISNPDVLKNFFDHLKGAVINIPIIGKFISLQLDSIHKSILSNKDTILSYTSDLVTTIKYIGAKSIDIFIKFLVALLVCYKLLADKDKLNDLFNEIVFKDIESSEELIDVAINTTRKVSLAVFLTAIITGAMMSIVYLALGLNDSIIFGLLTAVVAIIPFLPFLLYLILALGTFVFMGVTKAIILVCCGFVVGVLTEHIIKPKLINKGIELSFIASLLGIMGGITAFGVIGIFLGPVLFNVISVWINKSLAKRKKQSDY